MFRLEAEKGKLKVVASQLKTKEKCLADAEVALEEANKRLKELTVLKHNLGQQNDDMKKIVAKLEENLKKKEKLVEKRDEQLSGANTAIDSLKSVSFFNIIGYYFRTTKIKNNLLKISNKTFRLHFHFDNCL